MRLSRWRLDGESIGEIRVLMISCFSYRCCYLVHRDSFGTLDDVSGGIREVIIKELELLPWLTVQIG